MMRVIARFSRCPSTPGRVAPRSRPVTRGSVAGPVVLPVKIGPTLPAPWCCRRAALPGRLPTCCPWCCRPVNSRPVAPRSRPVTRGSVAGPVVLPGQDRPHAPGPWCCRRAALRPVADVLPVVLPARQLPAVAPRSRPVTRGSVAGPVVLPGQDRPHAPGPVVLPTCCAPGRLPTCCPWCCRPVNSRPVAPRSRPVTREALPAPWCCRSRSAPRSRPVVLPTCCAARPVADVLPVVLPAGQLPAGCPTLPAGHSGSVAGPWCCPVSRPHAPGPWCCRRAALPGRLPMCCPWCCRRAAHIACAGRSDFAGCAGAVLGSLTVLRGSPEKPCAGFSPGKHLREFGQLRPADRNQ